MGNEESRTGKKLNYDAVPAKHSGDLIELRDGILEVSLIQAKRLGFYAHIYPSPALGCSLKGV